MGSSRAVRIGSDVRNLLLVVVAVWLAVSGLGCVTAGANIERLAPALAERGLKMKNVRQQAGVTVGGSAAGSPVSGSGSINIDVHSNVEFDTVPIKDPLVALKFAFEDTGGAAVKRIGLTINGSAVRGGPDAQAAKQLADKHGGRWLAYSLVRPLAIGGRPGGIDSFGFNYDFAQNLPFTPAGTPMPTKLATRYAIQLDHDDWILAPLGDSLKYSAVLLSPAGQPPTIRRVVTPSTSGWTVRQGAQLLLPAVRLKNTTTSTHEVSLTAQVTSGRASVLTAGIGKLKLVSYDLQALRGASLGTRKLSVGTYSLVISAGDGSVRLGSVQLPLTVTR